MTFDITGLDYYQYTWCKAILDVIKKEKGFTFEELLQHHELEIMRMNYKLGLKPEAMLG